MRGHRLQPPHNGMLPTALMDRLLPHTMLTHDLVVVNGEHTVGLMTTKWWLFSLGNPVPGGKMICMTVLPDTCLTQC